MFFSRSRSTATTQSLIGSPVANSRPALEQALAPLAKKPEDRTNVVEELVDMNVAEPTRTDFTPQVCELVADWLFDSKKYTKASFDWSKQPESLSHHRCYNFYLHRGLQ